MNKWTAILKRKAAMAERGFSGARGLMYDHYTKYADDVERDTQSPVRKAFWFGRYGVRYESSTQRAAQIVALNLSATAEAAL